MNINQMNWTRSKTLLSLGGLLAILVPALLLGISLLAPQDGAAQQRRERTCGTDEVHRRLLATDPAYRRRRDELERFTKNYLATRTKRDFGARGETAVIPVVVHVVYNTAVQNITDAQINSQIAVLNEDFRRLNADAASVPSDFSSVAADARIQFQLAARDPECNETEGITRTSTTVSAFSGYTDTIKFAASGGHDAWPSDQYLNIWVGPISGLIGRGTFPGGPANVDGVIVNYTEFGNTGTATAPFHLGRSTTHEVGHWLNLYHSFQGVTDWDLEGCAGLSPSTCTTEGDHVCDTPPTAQKNFGTPPTQNTCSETPVDQNDQTMNYMDYVDDTAMFMFTIGQSDRMEAALFGTRASILGSDALIPPPTTVIAPDLFAQDTPSDTGAEPNTTGDDMYVSNDIWVRNVDDGLVHQEHQNPVYNGTPNYVYVRIRNRGCTDAASAPVQLYWAKASTGLSWPAPWDGSVLSPALMGNQIGVQPTSIVAGGGYTILKYAWTPPNPADYVSFGADKTHFCLLARIDTAMTFAETSDLYANVQNNNNLVWKNITVVESTSPGGREAAVTVGNFGKESVLGAWMFAPTKGKETPPIFRWGTITIDLGDELYAKWQQGGARGYGVKVIAKNTLQVISPNAWIADVKLGAREVRTIKVRFTPHQKELKGVNVYDFHIQQYQSQGRSYRLIGGEKFVLKTDYRR